MQHCFSAAPFLLPVFPYGAAVFCAAMPMPRFDTTMMICYLMLLPAAITRGAARHARYLCRYYAAFSLLRAYARVCARAMLITFIAEILRDAIVA